MKFTDLKISDLPEMIEKKLNGADGRRTIEVEEICNDYIALDYTDATGTVMDTDYFDIPESSDEEPINYVKNYLYEAIEYFKILIDALET